MASKIKGITIEIGGNTKPLEGALKNVNSASRDLNSELRNIESLLKLDPSNTELLAQKQAVLAQRVENSREKLDRLREAQEQVNRQFADNTINEEAYRAFNRELEAARISLDRNRESLEAFEGSLDNAGGAAEETGGEVKSFADILESVAETAGISLPDGLVKLVRGLEDTNGAGEESEGVMGKLREAFRGNGEEAGAFSGILENVVGSGGSGLLGLIGTVGKAAAAVIALAAAFDKLSESGAAQFEKQLEITYSQLGEVAAEYKYMAEDLYGDGLGDSLEDVLGTLTAVKRNLKEIDGEGLRQASQDALALAEVFDLDVGESTRAASALMLNFGVDVGRAMDAIAYGMQSGLDKSGDFIDTLIEYSPYFSQMGLSVEESMQVLSRGMEQGAMNVDKVADAVKEFSIRSIDGSASTSEAFRKIGLDAGEMSQAIAAGGERAKEAYVTVIQKLNEMDDAVEQDAAGVALFGTQWEDNTAKVILSLGNLDGAMRSVSGSMDGVTEGVTSGFSEAWERMERQGEELIDNVLMPLLSILTPLLNLISPLIGLAADLAGAVGSLINLVLTPFIALLDGLAQMLGWITDKLGAFLDMIGLGADKCAGELDGAISGIYDTTVNALDGMTGKAEESASVMGGLARDTGTMVRSEVGGAYQETSELVAEETSRWRQEMEDAMEKGHVIIRDGVKHWYSNETWAGYEQWAGQIRQLYSGLSDYQIMAISEVLQKEQQALQASQAGTELSIEQIRATVERVSGQMGTQGMFIGENLMSGMEQGIEAQEETLMQKISRIINRIKDAFTGQNGLRIHSPSAVTDGYGRNTMQGFINGFERLQGRLDAAVNSAVKSVGAMNNGPSLAFAGGGGGDTYYIVENVDMHAGDLKEIQSINRIFSGAAQNRRAGAKRRV